MSSMASTPRYQQLPVLSENIRRRGVGDNVPSATLGVVSSRHDDLGDGITENESFLDNSNLISREGYNGAAAVPNEEDITSAPGYKEPNVEIYSVPSSKRSDDRFHRAVLDWLPYTLRIPFLSILFALSLGLAAVVISMTWISTTHEGLGDDDSSSMLLFGWRFTPTLVVVLFVILETLLLSDARRTEVFARLSKPSATANAKSTVSSVRGHWWTDPLDAMSSKRNGGLRSQVLLYTAIINLIGSLILSPLSSAFLSVESTQISRSATFRNFPSISDATDAISPNDETYFKTISALVVNLTTSVWLTDDYAFIPFWSTDLSTPPLGATVPSPAQNWTSDTTVIQAELNCVPMTMRDLQQGDDFSFQLVSDDGCSMGIAVAVPLNTTSLIVGNADTIDGPIENDADEDAQYFLPILTNGSFWLSTSVGEYDFSNFIFTGDSFRNQTILTNVSSACQNRYILVANTAFNVRYQYPANYTVEVELDVSDISSNLSSFKINSHLCTSRYMMANVTATLSVSSSNTTISFDEATFNKSKVEIQPSDFNVSFFESAFYSDTWTKKLNSSSYGTWRGPSAPLGALYGFEAQVMIDDPLLLTKAQQVQQRFLGEGLMSAISKMAAHGPARAGMIAESKERVVANFGIGVTMGILFLCTSVMIVIVAFFSRLHRRPLNLERDPGSAADVSSLLNDPQTLSHFQGLERLPAQMIERRLGDMRFGLPSQGLVADHAGIIQNDRDQGQDEISPSKDWRPFVLGGTGGLTLASAIVLLIVAISVLYAISETRGIYQSGFVYQLKIAFKGGFVTSLAPYSIIPTLIAIGARFWWTGLEEAFSRLQPYVMMTKEAVPISAGAALSYQGFSSAMSAIKAIRTKHLLLALICGGTVLMEAFTVGMSALFQRVDSSLTSKITLSRALRLREIPQIFLVDEASDPDEGDTATPEILQQLFGESSVFLSWIYASVIELSYSGSSLAWTQDDWSFTPVNLNGTTSGPGISSSSEPANVTLDTSGLRGRLECTQVDMSNTSNWLTTWDLSNTSAWNMSAVTSQEKKFRTGYELGIGQVEGYPSFFLGSGPSNLSEGIWSTFFSNPSRIRCCANDSDGEPGLAALGYWAPVGESALLTGAEGHAAQSFDASVDDSNSAIYTNFTVTWVIGKPFYDEWEFASTDNNTDADTFNGLYLWSEIPDVISLNCLPIIEASNATIKIERDSGQVVDFSLLNDPATHEPAWSDYYLHHNNSGEDGDNIAYQIKDNVTVSYGYLFLDAMLGAADYARVAITGRWGYYDEPINDRVYAFRQTGYNSDLMSFATYSILQGNYSQILDPTILSNTSSTVFGKFFQHFVSEDSLSGGGRAFMPLNDTLPADFLPIINTTSGNITTYQDSNSSTISPTVLATLSRPVYKLQVSTVAVYLCLSILLFLFLTTVLVAIGYRNYFKALPRDVNTLASIIALVYDSPKLRKWALEDRDSSAMDVKAALGYFRGTDGELRWGIEIVDEEDEGRKEEKINRLSSRATSEYELLDMEPVRD